MRPESGHPGEKAASSDNTDDRHDSDLDLIVVDLQPAYWLEYGRQLWHRVYSGPGQAHAAIRRMNRRRAA